ncbi:hypothetical protein GCK72_010960 [Caenorhabditis remanei]|uniref:Uncharacterized protein n=1 Tax=Caenorhabditis remanei TaxID=31234 RepID=A0A6A5H4Q8_CAERE|nr:hypothetical protein GCK72_010960 [Caenorhabditis remanei]KAF1762698.1 hypothetical protein GCK72_010960 [Caenorhabditis remanei]
MMICLPTALLLSAFVVAAHGQEVPAGAGAPAGAVQASHNPKDCQSYSGFRLFPYLVINMPGGVTSAKKMSKHAPMDMMIIEERVSTILANNGDQQEALLCQLSESSMLLAQLGALVSEGVERLVQTHGLIPLSSSSSFQNDEDEIPGLALEEETNEGENEMEKRKHEYLRFGKRKHEYLRFGKRKHEYLR